MATLQLPTIKEQPEGRGVEVDDMGQESEENKSTPESSAGMEEKLYFMGEALWYHRGS